MMNETAGQMTLDATLVPGLRRAAEDWRVARRECQLRPTRETIGLYCEATDELAQALLGDLSAESGAQAVFERFHAWLIETEEELT